MCVSFQPKKKTINKLMALNESLLIISIDAYGVDVQNKSNDQPKIYINKRQPYCISIGDHL